VKLDELETLDTELPNYSFSQVGMDLESSLMPPASSYDESDSGTPVYSQHSSDLNFESISGRSYVV